MLQVNWQTLSPSFAKTWIQAHVDVCHAYNLPCVLGEFGRALGADEGNATAIASAQLGNCSTSFTGVLTSASLALLQLLSAGYISISSSSNTRLLASLPAGTRNPYFAAVYQTVQAEVLSKAPLQGDLFWQWVDLQNVGEQNGIVDTDSTFTQLIEPHAQFMQNHSGAVIC